MRLELADFPVEAVRLNGQTRYNKGVLEINKEELVSLILEDKRVASADLDVAFPGEQTRIVFVGDVVEPRVKVSGPGCVFPGIMGPVETVGEGRTHRMSGLTVIPSAQYRPTVQSGTSGRFAGVLDMWGPGAAVTPFGSTINIVPMLRLIDGVTEIEAHTIIQLAEFKIAQQLAETTKDKTPENVEVLELSQVDPSLPRVVYILGCLTEWHIPHSRVALYGLPIRESMPTLIHPNELFDGVLTVDTRNGQGQRPTTWGWMNHPVVIQLLKEHGKRLNFLGVIVQRTRFETEFGKQVTATVTSQMAKLMGAEGAITIRTTPSGNNFMDTMFTVQACEKKGIKMVLVTPEWGGKDGTELPLAFYVPEATSMVTTGSTELEIKLPAPAKVLGCKEGELAVLCPGDPPFSPWNELPLGGYGDITGAIDWFGTMNFTAREY